MNKEASKSTHLPKPLLAKEGVDGRPLGSARGLFLFLRNILRNCFVFRISDFELPKSRLLALIGGLFLLVFISGVPAAHAGFGITPPYVKNTSLTRSSKFEQKIILVRSEPVEDLTGTIVIDVPKANEWITIDKGTSFILPKGEKQFPIVVTVAVPKKADFGQYQGSLRITVSPEGGTKSGTVGIALGAQVDVDFTVIDKEIIDFKVRRIELKDLNEGHKFMWMYFPGKIRFDMQVENMGNVPAAPSQVLFDIYDRKSQTILESTKNSNKLQKVEPFETRIITAELPTKLTHGSYQTNYRIYKQELIAQEGVLDLSIQSYGTIAGDMGYGITGLSVRDKAILIAMLLAVLGIAWFVVRVVRKKRGGGRPGGVPQPYVPEQMVYEVPRPRRRIT